MKPLLSSRALTLWAIVLNFAIAMTAGLMIWIDATPEWIDIQKRYGILSQDLGTNGSDGDGEETFDIGIREIQISQTGQVDRCTTCHLGVEAPRMAQAPAPFSYHHHHDQHEFSRFGCSVCHGGDGSSLNMEEAHAQSGPHAMADMAHIESSCVQCHNIEDLSMASRLHEGQSIFDLMACRACHRLDGHGGTIAPALDGVGQRRSIDWMVKFFENPAAMVEDITMPPVYVDESQRESLAIFLKGMRPPNQLTQRLQRPVSPSALSGRRVFLEKGCAVCHDIKDESESNDQRWDIPNSWNVDHITQYLEAPHPFTKDGELMRLALSPEERKAISLFLISRRDPL